MAPINELVKNDLAFRKHNSDFYDLNYSDAVQGNYETFFVIGGFGVGGLGDGIRIGGGGYNSKRSYSLSSVSSPDSTKELEIDIGYGGIVLEKAWNREKAKIVVGTLLGAGSYDVNLKTNNNRIDLDFDNDDVDFHSSAAFFAGELRSSATISLTSWFHLGVEGFALLTASSSGFQYGDGFATFNGGGRLRILFGNLG